MQDGEGEKAELGLFPIEIQKKDLASARQKKKRINFCFEK